MRAFEILRQCSSAAAHERVATFGAADAIRRFLASFRFVAALALIAFLPAAPAVAQLDPCVPGQSCFTDVGDILNGQRHLLRTDDLLIGGLFGSAFAGAILDTTNSTVTASAASRLTGSNSQCLDFSPTFRTAASARMFNLNHDVTMSVACWGGFPYTLALYFDPDPDLPKPLFLSTNFGDRNGDNFQLFSIAADFTGDGYDDIALVGSTANADHFVPSAVVLTAVDPGAPDKGIRAGNPAFFDFPSVEPLAAVAGNFTGQGRPVIAILGNVIDATGAPAGLGIQFYTVDPVSLEIGLPTNGLQNLFTLNLPKGENGFIATASLAVGRFGNTTHDQLAVVYAVPGGTAKIVTIDFDSDGNAIQKAVFDTGVGTRDTPFAVIRAGHFDWSGSFDQAALLVQPGPRSSGSRIQLFGFDTSLNPAAGPAFPLTAGFCMHDLVAGNFDRMQANPDPPPANERNPNLQLALLASDCASSLTVSLLNVDPANGFAISPASTFLLPAALVPGPINYAALVATDSQGRSLRLGAPNKVVIAHRSQPSVVLGVPPMHVDFIAPARQTTPQVFNVSAIPAGFFTQYQTSQSNSNQSSTQNTTSWSAGTGESVSSKVTVGVPDVDSVTVKNKFSAQQAWKGNSESVHGTTSSMQFDVSQQTGFSDQLWYSDSRINLYIYPVIGQTGCPQAIPDCPDDEKVPLTVQFSGVDAVWNDTVPGNTTEWYQPPWEPGNVLSYPGNFQQLQAIEPDLDQLSGNNTFTTDQSTFLEKTTWSKDSTKSLSTSFDQNYSFNDTLSVSASTNFIFASASIKGTLSLSGSFGFSNLHTSVTTLGNSSGIGVQKPGTFASPPDYQYHVTPFIFGQQRPAGVVNDIPLSTDVTTFGVLQTAFVVDPLSGDAGGWWKQTYTAAPDVALNHPTRWSVKLASGSNNPNDGTCLGISAGSSDIDCASLSPSDANDPWLSDFHTMRGLFVTGAQANGKGPQLDTATAGDQLLLQARVYNYSLAPMPAGTTVHTRFYGNRWDNSKLTAIGQSFLIGESVTGQIPPFNTDTAAPNWQRVAIPKPFDTTNFGDQYLVFWVVVWMEDGNGKLVAELPGHGLTAVPGALTQFADVAPFEEPYDNNVGFYKSAFYVFPKPGGSLAAKAKPGSPKPEPAFRMTSPTVSVHKLGRGERIVVDLSLVTGDQPIDGGTTVRFYDGDPAKGGKAFDLERIPYLRARDAYRVSVPFASDQCGPHHLFVAAARGSAFETIERAPPVIVHCTGRGG
ncbi:MAG TPA: hypothetical protein VLN42_03485 [Casimicrobiaceae bacterium]|nr:hypothetical protein [Casimicrobiaceae bacterium]